MRKFFAFCIAFAAGISLVTLAASPAFAADTTITVSAKIKDPVNSADRATKYEDPLDAALKEAKLGEVTGGGNSVDAHGKIEWAGVDIEVTNVEAAIPLIKQKLQSLGAPKGSTLEYRAGGRKVVVPIQ